MIASVMLYGLLVSSLFGAAAWITEHVFAAKQWPRRGVWGSAILLSLLFPAIMVLAAKSEFYHPSYSMAPNVAQSALVEVPLLQYSAQPTTSANITKYVRQQFRYTTTLDTSLKYLWFSGSLCLLIFYLVVSKFLQYQARQWQRVSLGKTVVLVTDCIGPAVVGFFRPQIVLPRWLLTSSPTTRDLVLAHEQSHIVERDPLMLLSALLLVALTPWNIPLWWQLRRLRFAIEVDCDARVLRTAGTDVVAYGETLLTIGQYHTTSPIGSMTLSEPKSQLERRIHIMIHGIYRKVRLLIVGGVALSALLIAAVTQLNVPILADAVAADSTGGMLIFRNIPSWNRKPDFEDSLDGLGLKYVVKQSAEMKNSDLSSFDVILIPGAQWKTDYYADFAKNLARFERYVAEGGTLVLELNGAEREGISLPGGVTMVLHPALDNLVTLPNHPILIPFSKKPRISATLASHGYLKGVPENSLVLAVEMTSGQVTPDMSKPTFVEYSYGKGRIIAAAQCFHDRDGSGRGPLMTTLLKYATAKRWFLASN